MDAPTYENVSHRPRPAVRPAIEVQRHVSDSEFDEVVQGALDAVGGTLLFKLRVDHGEQPEHVATAFVGDGSRRQFLVLTLPVGGGELSVETAKQSDNPLARIAASYAGLAEALAAAA